MSEETFIDADALAIAPEKVCYVILSSRELDTDDMDDDDDESTVAVRDLEADTDPSIEEFDNKEVHQELHDFIDGLNEEEQINLVALMWVGRGEFNIKEWTDALEEAENLRNVKTADYLIDTPMLADYLEEGLDQFDISCEDIDTGRL